MKVSPRSASYRGRDRSKPTPWRHYFPKLAFVRVRPVIASLEQVLADAKAQGIVGRNLAELVNRVSKPHQSVDTYTEVEVRKLLAAIAGDRLAHAWELALSGLRRGEIAGLRWADVDLEGQTMAIVNNRVSAGGRSVENDPKSATSRRNLPLPDRLVATLKAAKARQATERLALGAAYRSGMYVVSNEIGDPYSAGRPVSILARLAEVGGNPAHQTARRAAYLRHVDASARRPRRRDRRMDRTQGRQPDDAALRA